MPVDRSIDTLAYRRAGGIKTTGSFEPIPGRCGGKLTFTGLSPENPPKYCMHRPVAGRTRCHWHGGAVPTGIASAHYKPGIYSTALKGKVRADYEALLADPALLSLKHEIAMTRARLRAQLDDVEEKVSGACVAAVGGLLTAWDAFQAARRTDAAALKVATGGLETAMGVVRETFAPERRQADAMKEIRADTGLLERLERSENTRVKELYDMISGERAFALRQAETAVFLEAITLHVPERKTQDAIRRHVAAKFAELTGRRDPPALVAGGGSESGVADSDPDHG